MSKPLPLVEKSTFFYLGADSSLIYLYTFGWSNLLKLLWHIKKSESVSVEDFLLNANSYPFICLWPVKVTPLRQSFLL